MRVHRRLERTDKQNYCMARAWVGNNWNIIDFPCPVGKMVKTSFRLKATNKAFFCCSVRLLTPGKRSSSTEVKNSSNILSGTTTMSKSRNMACLYVPWSSANVIASAVYKQFSSLVERGKIYLQKWGVKIFSVPSVVTIKRANQIGLRVWKNINQSTPEGQILTLSSAWKWDSRPR